MKRSLGMLLATTALMAVPAAAQDATSVLQAADRAMGAGGVNSVLYTATGTIRYPGQSYDAKDDWPKAPLTAYTATIDYPSKSSKEDYTVDLSKKDVRGGGLPIPKSTDFVNGGTAWNINPQGQTNPQPNAAELRQFMITVSPYGFIKAALASGNATLENRYFNRLDETVKVVGFNSGKYRFTGEFDKDNLLSRVVTWFPSPVLGDMPIEVRYSDWKDVGGGAKFPFHIHAHQGDHPLNGNGRNWYDLRVSDAKVNVPDAAVAVPDAIRSTPAPQARVASQKLADGVWFIGGGSHNSLAVEHKDFVTVIEGPLDDARSNAVIAETHKLIPNKPIRYLVNSHHHWDHSGGIRAFVAEGATVVTDDKNKEFYRDEVLVPQPRSLSPDRLSQFPFAATGPGTLALQTFTDRTTVGDETRMIELYHVEGLPHASDMLVAYLPQSKILVNADLYSPPAAGGNLAVVNPNAVALFNNVKRLKLDVAQHVPIHGNPGGQADFDRIVGPVAAKAPRPGDGG
ncbi:MAG: MBL fold metallo-hydrolase [Xanthobacteraceae bacterium]|nr:MBL fold metallo-hydrolase [Xanthobacteraceae bacterium]